ncbi:MAG: hypothetical protein FJ280_30070 [Planctomycetes bacterium]|nr:hypothetical protein [Planctomycetota bacterium]
MKAMTNRERVVAALHGEPTDRTPFTTYEWKIPWGEDKRKLIERGLTMMMRFPGVREAYAHCEWTMATYMKDGKKWERETISTPKGDVSSLFLPDQTNKVRKQVQHWIKGEADYEPLIHAIDDTVFSPSFEEIRLAQESLGEDGYVYIWAGYSPLQEIIIRLMGIEQFSYELAERPDHLWALYDALWRREQRRYEILADAPVEMVQACGNPIASVLGRKRFVDRVLPPLAESAAALHAAGKLQAVHIDGDNAIWAKDLAASPIDILEAFTPAPDTDMTIAQGRQAFKDKILWANFPSSVHLASAETVRATTQEILEAVAPGRRFLLGITEDVPPQCWRTSFNAILDTIDDFCR